MALSGVSHGMLWMSILSHMEGVNILAVNYGSSGSCRYPCQLKLPAKWSFKLHTVLKSSDQATRLKVKRQSQWMCLIPLGLIIVNAMTQAMNMAEEPATGQAASQAPALG